MDQVTIWSRFYQYYEYREAGMDNRLVYHRQALLGTGQPDPLLICKVTSRRLEENALCYIVSVALRYNAVPYITFSSREWG